VNTVWLAILMVLVLVATTVRTRRLVGGGLVSHAPGRAVHAELCANVARQLGQVPAGSAAGAAAAGVEEAAWEEHRTLFRKAPDLHDAIERTYAALREGGPWLDLAIEEGLPATGAAAGMSDRDVLLSIACLVGPTRGGLVDEGRRDV
jgi:hypothetical protein